MAQRAHATTQEARAPRPAKRSAAPRDEQEIGLGRSVTYLNEADFKAFEAAIAEPGKPNAELRELIEHSRRLLKDV